MAVIKPYELIREDLNSLRKYVEGLELKHGEDGKTVEIRRTDNAIQWRYNDEDWQILIPLSAIQGEQGERGEAGRSGNDGKDGKDGKDGQRGLDGKAGNAGKDAKEIELRATDTLIQWRRVGERWQTLIALSELKGKDGKDGRDGGVSIGGGGSGILVSRIEWVESGGERFDIINTSTTLQANQSTVEVTASATITLPTASGVAGKKYQIANTSDTFIDIDTSLSQTIGNCPPYLPIRIYSGEVLQVISNGSDWRII